MGKQSKPATPQTPEPAILPTAAELDFENQLLRQRLQEAEETIHAIRNGEVDAFVIWQTTRDQVYTLQTADRPYRMLVERMQQGAVTLAPDGTALYCNRSFGEMVGERLEDIVGTTIQRFVEGASRRAFETLLEEGRSRDSQSEVLLVRRDGVTLPTYVTANRVSDEQAVVCLVFSDLTERRRHEEVKASETLSRSILEQATDAIVVCDEGGRIIRASRAAQDLCGTDPLLKAFEVALPLVYEGDELSGLTRQDEPVLLKQALQGELVRGLPVRLCCPHTGQKALLFGAGPLRDDSGKIIGCVVSLTDISERKRAEEALKEADRRKDEFLAILAHELRNPLAPLNSALGAMRLAGNDSVVLQELRGIMERQVNVMVRLIDDLMDVARIDRNKLQLQKQRVELETILNHAIETCGSLIEERGQELTVTLPPPPPIILEADPTRLAQVFSNLLNNAAKYTERGGHIEVSVERQGSDAVVTVRDNGVGIPVDQIHGIFEMFSQVDRSLDRSQGGLGIGLTLVRRLTEMHHGTIEARSDGLGKGSEFIVRLPISMTLPNQEGTLVHDLATGGTGARILIVDDNLDAVDSLGLLLTSMGYEVRTATDGLEAIEAAAGFQPQVVLLDIGMPKLNGYAVAERLRQQPRGKEMLLVAMTGWGQEEDRRRSVEAGFDHHLVKPVDPAALEKLFADRQPASV